MINLDYTGVDQRQGETVIGALPPGKVMERDDMATVLDVGNCDPDHGMIKQMLRENFDVRIDRVMFVDDALARMRDNRYDLVLFNRLIFEDGSAGIELLTKAKADPTLRGMPIMMISNFEDAQAASIAAGGEPGFGKNAVFATTTIEILSRYLPKKKVGSPDPAMRQ